MTSTTSGAVAWVRAMREDGFAFRLRPGGDPDRPNDYSISKGGDDASPQLLAALMRMPAGAGRAAA